MRRYSDIESMSEDEAEQFQSKKQKKPVKICGRRFKIPVVFHNLKGYDGHILLRAITKSTVTSAIDCIPQQGERFLSFSFHNLKFIDSLQFLNSSLEKLASNIPKDEPKSFYHLKQNLPAIARRFGLNDCNEDHLTLLLQKGVYPYDYMDSFDRFEETELPPIETFKSILDDSDLEEKDYEHAKSVWNEFNMKTMGDYHDLYLLTDVLLLADIVERFRDQAIHDTRLDPLHYLSLPGYSMDACFAQLPTVHGPMHHLGKKSVVDHPFQVGLITDCASQKEMHLMVESAVRGGISTILHRHSEANHKGLKQYDSSKKSKYIMYLDANNLYGWAMSQPLPVADYKYNPKPESFTASHIQSLSPNGDLGYLLEVDLHVPIELHDKFRSYPLAPVARCVEESEISPYTVKCQQVTQSKHDGKTKKLLLTLEDKVKYIVHYRNLQLYLKLGYQLKKVHKVIQFRQEKWMAGYIDSNTKKRAVATNDFDKDYYKLMNNAIFGKTLEDVRKHRNARIHTRESVIGRALSHPLFDGRYILNEDAVVMYSKKSKITLNKPMIAGATILDLSKLHMYDFYYNVLQVIFGVSRLRLLFTDTDSLCFEVETEDFHKEIVDGGAKDHFDFSNYPPEHPLYDKKNKAVLGKFKDETGGFWIKEFVGLRPKLYSILKDEKTMMGEILDYSDEKKVAKGVKKHIIKKKLRHSQYRDCLLNADYNPLHHLESMVGFSTVNNQILTTSVNKLTLTAADNKVYICNDGVTCFPYGYYKINSISNHNPIHSNQPSSQSSQPISYPPGCSFICSIDLRCPHQNSI